MPKKKNLPTFDEKSSKNELFSKTIFYFLKRKIKKTFLIIFYVLKKYKIQCFQIMYFSYFLLFSLIF